MRFKKFFVLMIGCLMLLSMALAGCNTQNPNNNNSDDGIIEEDITVEGIDKTDPYTWFDVTKTDLPSLKECQEITEGMSLNQVIRKIGKPQRDIGYGTMILQFDVDDGSVFTVSFLKGKDDPAVADYDKWVVFAAGFDTEIPDVYFPYYGTLNDLNSWIENDLYSWIDELNVEEIVEVRYERSFTSVAPGRLKDIAYSTNSVDIENTYRLLFSPLTSISEKEGKIEGGGYVRYDFTTANNETYSITVENDIIIINNYYFKFVDNFYYAFQYSDVDCNSFITYDIPAYEEYEIYTYANESVKVGDYDGLGEFEFCVYDGLIENTPKFYLRSSVAVNLLILSNNQFMIEGEGNTTIYQITGDKDFSFLFTE